MDLDAPTHQFGDFLPALPLEICDLINEYIAGGRPDQPYYFGTLNPAVCRVNSYWNRIFTPVLYTHFQFHGNINRVKSLYAFLHTLYMQPNLAAYVTELTLTTWDIYEAFVLKDMAKDSEFISHYSTLFDDEASSSQAGFDGYLTQSGHIRAAYRRHMKAWYANAHFAANHGWLSELMEKVFPPNSGLWATDNPLLDSDRRLNSGAMHRGYQAPLTALVIALCPNLQRLNFDLWNPGQDIWFPRVLDYATGRRRVPEKLRGNNRLPLQKLEVVKLAARQVQPISNASSIRRGQTHLPEFYRLPALRDLSWFNGTFDESPILPPNLVNGDGPSAITALTLNGDFDRSYQLPALFAWTSNLRQLSLTFTADNASPDHDPTDGPVHWAWLWKQLVRFSDQLEYLDLYQRPFPLDGSEDPIFEDITDDGTQLQPFCPPLARFTKLTHLAIPPLGLHGFRCRHAAGTKFRAHCPPSLRSIGLYTEDDGDWVLDTIPQFAAELEGIALGGAPAQGGRLRAIVTDCVQATVPTALLQAAASRFGMFYSPDARKHCFFAGSETVWGDFNDADIRARGVQMFFEARMPEMVIPTGMTVHDIKGKLKLEP
ncbi:hypothetical protein BJX64DRAFT_290062 [Aspergillus heterothallicus]